MNSSKLLQKQYRLDCLNSLAKAFSENLSIIDSEAEKKYGLESSMSEYFANAWNGAEINVENAAVADPGLQGFTRVFDEVDEPTIYESLNPQPVGAPGDNDVNIPFYKSEGEAVLIRKTQFQSKAKKSGNKARVYAEVLLDKYPVFHANSGYTINDDTIEQAAALAAKSPSAGLSILAKTVNTCMREVKQRINTFVLQGLVAQAGRSILTATAGVNWNTDSTTGLQKYKSLLAALTTLRANNKSFLPRIILMHPNLVNHLGDIVGTNAGFTVLATIDEVGKRYGLIGGTTFLTDQNIGQNHLYILDNSPDNFLVGFTKNITMSRVVLGLTDQEQEIFADTIGFAPTVNGFGVRLDVSQ